VGPRLSVGHRGPTADLAKKGPRQLAAKVLMNLAWTSDEIDQDWLLGSKLAVTPNEIVTAFNRLDNVLGRG